jgi:hypothetical protein
MKSNSQSTQYQVMKLKKKSIKKESKNQPYLICQTCNPGHKTEITPWKTNQNKLWISIFN